MIGNKVTLTQVWCAYSISIDDLCSLYRNVGATWDSDRKIDVNHQTTGWGEASNQSEGDYLVSFENCEDWGTKIITNAFITGSGWN